MTGENTGDNPRRVLLKLSGEAFGGGKVGIDTTVVRRIAEEIVPAVRQGVQVAIVVGGGNFFRGAQLQQRGGHEVQGPDLGSCGHLGAWWLYAAAQVGPHRNEAWCTMVGTCL